MKEILYISAGELSNYTSAHFWNTQESYLQSEDQDSVASEISFCETMDTQVSKSDSRQIAIHLSLTGQVNIMSSITVVRPQMWVLATTAIREMIELLRSQLWFPQQVHCPGSECRRT